VGIDDGRVRREKGQVRIGAEDGLADMEIKR
jgi:hypothetical protein